MPLLEGLRLLFKLFALDLRCDPSLTDALDSLLGGFDAFIDLLSLHIHLAEHVVQSGKSLILGDLAPGAAAG